MNRNNGPAKSENMRDVYTMKITTAGTAIGNSSHVRSQADVI